MKSFAGSAKKRLCLQRYTNTGEARTKIDVLEEDPGYRSATDKATALEKMNEKLQIEASV